MCQRGNCPFSNLKRKQVDTLPKTLLRLKQEWQKSPALGPGKQMTKTWFGLEKQKETEQLIIELECLVLTEGKQKSEFWRMLCLKCETVQRRLPGNDPIAHKIPPPPQSPRKLLQDGDVCCGQCYVNFIDLRNSSQNCLTFLKQAF